MVSTIRLVMDKSNGDAKKTTRFVDAFFHPHRIGHWPAITTKPNQYFLMIKYLTNLNTYENLNMETSHLFYIANTRYSFLFAVIVIV